MFCAWALDDGNCWRQLVRDVDQCLHAELGEGDGKLARGGARCVDARGRFASFATPLVAGASMGQALDVTIGYGAATCLHLVRAARTREFTATSSGHVVSVREEGETTSVKCPDGREVRFTEDDALSCGVSEPEIERALPGLSVSDEVDPRATRLRLSGGAVMAFACVAQ